jgi:hypothetical protein
VSGRPHGEYGVVSVAAASAAGHTPYSTPQGVGGSVPSRLLVAEYRVAGTKLVTGAIAFGLRP